MSPPQKQAPPSVTDWLRSEFNETRPMEPGATKPAPASEPPAWTLPGELAALLKKPKKPKTPQVASAPAPDRDERGPSAPERRHRSREVPQEGTDPRPSAPAPVMPPGPHPEAVDTAPRPPTELGKAPLTERALIQAIAACLVMVAVVGVIWWMLDHADDPTPSRAALAIPPRPAPSARDPSAPPAAPPELTPPAPTLAPLEPPQQTPPQAATQAAEPAVAPVAPVAAATTAPAPAPASALAPAPAPTPATAAATEPPPPSTVATDPARPPTPRVAPPQAAPTRVAQAQAVRPPKRLSCTEVLARQSLGDPSVTSPSAARSCR